MTRPVVIAGALVGVIGGLILVGIVSHTLLRHFIQVVPAGIVLFLMLRRVPWSHTAALPVFCLWFLIMLGIWLYLLGVAQIVTGHFSAAEIALTFLIGLSCVLGVASWFSTPSRSRPVVRFAVLLAFTVLQVVAIWLSTRPFVANM